jgi:hypothetical protein
MSWTFSTRAVEYEYEKTCSTKAGKSAGWSITCSCKLFQYRCDDCSYHMDIFIFAGRPSWTFAIYYFVACYSV